MRPLSIWYKISRFYLNFKQKAAFSKQNTEGSYFLPFGFCPRV